MNETKVVGIAGCSAAGKTTFADALIAALEGSNPPRSAAVFHLDQYTWADKTAGPFFLFSPTGEKLFNMNDPAAFDYPRLMTDMDARLAAGDRPDVLIIEGLMALHEPTLRHRLNLRLYVDLEADERVLRRMLRDMAGGRMSRDPQFIADFYRESARIGQALYVEPSRIHADMILRGDGDFARLARLMTSVIRDC
ncbi:MAG: uridine kinase family protein [Janthinobacterium lividum]